MSDRALAVAAAEERLAAAVDEFMAECHNGRRPDVEAYAGRYPELAECLRQVLPALTLLGPASAASDGATGDAVPEVGQHEHGRQHAAELLRVLRMGRREGRHVHCLPASSRPANSSSRFSRVELPFTALWIIARPPLHRPGAPPVVAAPGRGAT